MQDFEIPRYNAALAGFTEAFEEGYAEGLNQLASGAERLREVPHTFPLEVSRDNVVDGNWHQHVAHFREAGRVAALATRRTGTPKLDASQATDESHVCFNENKYRWHVVLNPTTNGTLAHERRI